MRKLSTRERVLLAILVVVAVVSGYVLLFSMPLKEKIQTLGQEIVDGAAEKAGGRSPVYAGI